MSPSREPQPTRRALTADEINDAIRAYLRPRSGRPLFADEAAQYALLRDQWCTTSRGEITTAA
jgi:hypothetical protein